MKKIKLLVFVKNTNLAYIENLKSLFFIKFVLKIKKFGI